MYILEMRIQKQRKMFESIMYTLRITETIEINQHFLIEWCKEHHIPPFRTYTGYIRILVPNSALISFFAELENVYDALWKDFILSEHEIFYRNYNCFMIFDYISAKLTLHKMLHLFSSAFRAYNFLISAFRIFSNEFRISYTYSATVSGCSIICFRRS